MGRDAPRVDLPVDLALLRPPPEGNPPVEREPKRVRDLTLIDPCAGSGHFLVRAFELFVQLYAEEGREDPAEVPALILERNLYGADIDRRAVQIAALALYLKGCEHAGADFQPRRVNLVACDVVLPPNPPAELLDSFEEPELKDLARSLWDWPRRGAHVRHAAPSRACRQRDVQEAQGEVEGHALGTDEEWSRSVARS